MLFTIIRDFIDKLKVYILYYILIESIERCYTNTVYQVLNCDETHIINNVINTKDKHGRTLLMLATQKESNLQTTELHEIIKALLNHSETNINVRDKYGYTVLHYAIIGSKPIDVIKALVDHGANVHAEDNYGRTPLTWAEKTGYHEIVGILKTKKLLAETVEMPDV